jgi:phenylalanyl-tRNA synthetase beta chain
MKLPERWLREWVHPPVDTDALVAQLSMAGLEVDGVEPAAAAFSGVVVGEVSAVEPHPDADKLRVCTVADGEGTHTVVCGAPNVAVGMKAPYARVGAQLPGGLAIRRAKLRGVESAGMLCGADELGLAEERDGLLALPGELETGADLRAALALDDAILDVDLTPNRGDCLSVRGLAREVGVLNDVHVCGPRIDPVPGTIDDVFPVRLSAPEDCPRYLGRVIRGVDVARPSPPWLVERLRRCGLRSIDPVVDVTNYVMLELGQPMHAFDLARLEGGIDVRRARDGDVLVLLDGSEVRPDPDTLLITDGAGPVALAGIMGGERSGIEATGEARTRDIFLECAYFSPPAVAGRARRHGLQTDASQRYERGVDFELQREATERATRLLLDIVGGEAGPVSEAVVPEALPQRARVRLRASRLRRLLGTEIPAETVDGILERLGFPVVEREGEGEERVWSVQAPSFRFDIEREADLVEEVARVHGYDRLEVALPEAALHLPSTEEDRLSATALRTVLVGEGCREIVTYSFVEPAFAAPFAPDVEPLALANPLSADLAVLRPSLLPGLVRTWIANRNRQQTRARLFEYGRVFLPRADGGHEERDRVAGLLAGTRAPEQWGTPVASVDFFDARGLVEALVDATGDAESFAFEPGDHPAFHPGQCARVLRDGAPVGHVGRIHPQVQEVVDLPQPVYLFELEIEPLAPRRRPAHAGLSRFPALRRDLAVELEATIAADRVLASARRAGGALVTGVHLFDVYTGEGLEPGRRSLALALVLQHPERTLEDTEATEVLERVLGALEQEFGARRR